MMTIRELDQSEVGIAAEFGPLFFSEGGLPGDFIDDVFIANWATLISQNSGVILCAFDEGVACGVLGAIRYPDVNSGEIVSTEAFWFVKKEYRGGMMGIRLLDAYENWAKDNGCKRVGMVHLCNLHPDGLRRLYERRGYRITEVSYFKDIN